MSRASRPVRRIALWAGAAMVLFLAGPGSGQTPGGNSPEGPLRYFTPEQIARGKAYRFGNRVAYFVSLAAKIAALVLLSGSCPGRSIRGAAGRLASGRAWVAALCYSAFILLLLSLVSLPTSFYSGYSHEHAFGLSTQGAGDWLRDFAKSTLLGLALFSPVGLVLWALTRRFPAGWWLPAWAAAGVGSVLLVFSSPILIDPVFHTFTPIRDEAFRRRTVELAERAGIRVEEVLEMDASRKTRRVNAYFTGLGRTKRIVVYDNLLRGASPEEAELVLAHEMGHWSHDHVWKGIGWSCLGTLVLLLASTGVIRRASSRGLFGLPDAHGLAVLPLLLLMVVVMNFLSLPVQNAISRGFERQADLASLDLTRRPDVFVEVERRLALTNLADVSPGPVSYALFYTHPSVMERIGMALEYGKRRGGER